MAAQAQAHDPHPQSTGPDGGQRLKRRGALAGVAALLVGALARWTAQPAVAGTDGDLVLNATNTATATTTLQNSSTGGSFTRRFATPSKGTSVSLVP